MSAYTTAGMVRGTPDWQLDRMVETAAAEEWEKMNEPEPKAIDRYDFDTINRAWAALETARLEFGLLEDNICNALQTIAGTPEADKLASIYDALSDLRIETNGIREGLKNEAHRAWRETRFAG